MKKIALSFLVLLLAVLVVPSCKSKQKVTEIPQSAYTPASSTTTTVVTNPVASDKPVVEVIRDEKFTLAEGETNTKAFQQKYHVVVGSFKSHDNAKGLQATLNKEGNSSIIVVNEQGMFRVLIASYNDYKEAHRRIDQISSRFPDAWVLIQKM